MSSPERPTGPEHDERQLPPYHKAARFAGDRPAGQVYGRLQAILYRASDTDLSAYRLLLDRVYHVAVLGMTPPETVDRRIMRLLARGATVTLPDAVVAALAARRRNATRLGRWVEGHVRPVPPKEQP